jgi:hypothetical protein
MDLCYQSKCLIYIHDLTLTKPSLKLNHLLDIVGYAKGS